MAQLSDRAAVTINNLAPRPFAPYHPDLIYNPAQTGPASSQTKLDGYTKVLTFAAPLDSNTQNTLEIKIKDGRDGLLDSAVFIKAGTFGTSSPILGNSIQVKNDTLSTDENTVIAIDPTTLLLNDIPTNPGDTLSITSINGTGTVGTVSFDGSLITYNPAQKFESLAKSETAIDQFGYSVSDGKGGTSSGQVRMTITGVNDNPIAIDDTVTTTDTGIITIATATLLRNDSDVDTSDTLSITDVDTAINGTASLNANRGITFISDSTSSGQGSFKYTISDGNGGTATALVNIFGSFTTSFNTINGNDIFVDTAANDKITGFQGSDTKIGSNGKNLSTDPIADSLIQARSQGSTHSISSIAPDGFGTFSNLRPLTLMQNVTRSTSFTNLVSATM